MRRALAHLHRVRSLWLVMLVLGTSGCGLVERAAACGKVAQAALVPSPKKRRTARAEELTTVASDLRGAAKRLTEVGPLPKDLAPIAGSMAQEVGTFAMALETAAQAKKKSRAPDYATARLRTEESRQKLMDLNRRFGEVCSK